MDVPLSRLLLISFSCTPLDFKRLSLPTPSNYRPQNRVSLEKFVHTRKFIISGEAIFFKS